MSNSKAVVSFNGAAMYFRAFLASVDGGFLNYVPQLVEQRRDDGKICYSQKQ